MTDYEIIAEIFSTQAQMKREGINPQSVSIGAVEWALVCGLTRQSDPRSSMIGGMKMYPRSDLEGFLVL